MKKLLLCMLIATSACGTGNHENADDADDDPQMNVGHISVPLSTVGSDGRTYVLQNAFIDGNGPASFTVQSDGSAVVTVDVPAGDYTLTLRDGWNLAVFENGMAVPIGAELASKNPLPVRVESTLFTTARFLFLLGSDDGQLEIGFDVSSNNAVVSGKIHVDQDFTWDGDPNHTNVENGFTGLIGEDVEVRARWGELGSTTFTNADGSLHTTYFATPTRVVFSGNPWDILPAEFAPRLTGNLIVVNVFSSASGSKVNFTIYDYQPDGFVVMALVDTPILGLTTDANGFPRFLPNVPYNVDTTSLFVERYRKDSDNSYTRVASMSGSGRLVFQLP